MSTRTEEYDARQIISQFDAPAFVRRARHVEAAWEEILGRCRRQRDTWLEIPRMRLGMLRALSCDWAVVQQLTGGEETRRYLAELHEHWQPRLRAKVVPTRSPRQLRQAWVQLCQAMERFNGRWIKFIRELELDRLNSLRTAYNLYYPLEKECAVGSQRIASYKFEPLPPASHDDLLARFPLLRIPPIAPSPVNDSA